MSIEQLYTLYRQFPVVTTDSRKIPPRSMFFALKGEHFDGNHFAAQALNQGAAVAVVDNPDVVLDRRYILVDDVLQSLQQLARHHREQLDIPVIGITGSNGKTTTKELIHSVLSTRFRTHATSGNLNNHIGVPLTLLSLMPGTEMAIIEMGANHIGEIAFLCELAKPTHGLITNIGRAHLEGFGGFEGVIRAKTELYAFLRSHPGEVFVNAGDPILTDHSAGLPLITYGMVPDGGTSGQVISEPIPGGDSGIEVSGSGKLSMQIAFPDDAKTVLRSSLFGSYNALNLLAAACIGYHFKIPARVITRALEAYIPGNNRSQVHKTSKNLLILDAYNANPSSMAAALIDFNHAFRSGKVVILGDMLELGPEAEQEHLGILEMINQMTFNRVFLVGPHFSKLNNNPEWITFETSPEAREWFTANPVKEATILLKGSRGIRLEEIVPQL